jgi:hypothetical protein
VPVIIIHIHQRVAITRAVDKPGFREIIGPRTLLEVLSLAGWFSNNVSAQLGDMELKSNHLMQLPLLMG